MNIEIHGYGQEGSQIVGKIVRDYLLKLCLPSLADNIVIIICSDEVKNLKGENKPFIRVSGPESEAAGLLLIAGQLVSDLSYDVVAVWY
ncbi:MAG: hypothetical protein HY764_00870 [Candidatus Portnoybacteria bacterium]|nr:hypothetical protein [Candidatus Portnoybacteria bacterium]